MLPIVGNVGGRRMEKKYDRLRLNSGQHRRVMLAALLLGLAAFVPVGVRLYGLMIRDYEYYAGLALRNQPVHHLHQLIPARLTGLGGIHTLLRANHQRHGIRTVSRAVVQTPFVHAGRRGFDVLIEGTFFIRVQLCGVGSIRWR